MIGSAIRPFVKELIYNAAHLAGLTKLARASIANSFVILTYHSFSEHTSKGLFHSMSIKQFEQQLIFLKKYFRVIPLSDALQKASSHTLHDQGKKPVAAITIDDGFLDNYTVMLNTIRRQNVPVTIFIATDFIDTSRPPWPTQIIEILEQTELPTLEYPTHLPLRNLAEKSCALQVVKKLWKGLIHDARFKNIEELKKHAKVAKPWKVKPLTWTQIKEMRMSLVEFGSHTVYHSILTDVPMDVAREELLQSKKRIEEEVDDSCTLFSYPNGDWNTVVSGLVQAAGYKAAVTQDRGANPFSGRPSHYSLRRIEVPFNETLGTFACRSSLLAV